MKFKNKIFGLFSFITLLSCSSVPTLHTEKKYNIKEIVADKETVLVDVRVKEEFELKTVKGAINIPLADLENKLELLKSKKNVVVFCNRGRQSDLAIELLEKKGLTNVYDGTTWQNVRAIQQENNKK